MLGLSSRTEPQKTTSSLPYGWNIPRSRARFGTIISHNITLRPQDVDSAVRGTNKADPGSAGPLCTSTSVPMLLWLCDQPVGTQQHIEVQWELFLLLPDPCGRSSQTLMC